MDNLPCEIIDEIFSYLDGISLARTSCVCQTWKRLHEQKLYNLSWKAACLREFASEALNDIIGFAQCKYNKRTAELARDFGEEKENENSNRVDWKKVYKECYRSWFIGKWPSLGTELKGHSGKVYAVKFSGERVITCGEDTTVRIWDSWTGSCLRILQEHQQEVFCLALRRKNGISSHHDHPHDLIVSGSEDFTVCIWDLDKEHCIKRIRQSSHVNCVAVQDSIVIAGCGNNCAEVWDIGEGNDKEPLCIVNTHDWIRYVGFWKDLFLTVTDKNRLDFWSFSGENIASVLNPTNMSITSAVVRGDRTMTLSYCGKLSAWQHRRQEDGGIDLSILRCYNIIAAGIAGILEGTCMAIYGCLVAIGTKHGMINVYHLEKDWDNQFQFIHTVVHSNDFDAASFSAIDVSDDGAGPTLVSAGSDGIVRVERWFPWPKD